MNHRFAPTLGLRRWVSRFIAVAMSADTQTKMQEFKASSLAQIAQSADVATLTALKTTILGKKSPLTELLKSLGQSSPEERKSLGTLANEIKQALSDSFETRENELKNAAINAAIAEQTIDVTLPGLASPAGHHHPVMQIFHDACEIFRRLGFDISTGPEIESDYYNFEALNIPKDHPARDMQDTFYVDDNLLLRTHTSPVQIRVMESQKPPIAMVAPGVVYRCDSDQTHTPMFHQIEGLVVDKNIHFGHLKGIVQDFLSKIFERKLDFRFRPSFFPFTEPSAEVDITCVFCSGKGCRVCKTTGWLEVMGCGMVDPNVFNFVKINPAEFTGFAFGAGLERLAMLKYGINDLRLFFENDVRFLKQL